jgi:hypothetical protein
MCMTCDAAVEDGGDNNFEFLMMTMITKASDAYEVGGKSAQGLFSEGWTSDVSSIVNHVTSHVARHTSPSAWSPAC